MIDIILLFYFYFIMTFVSSMYIIKQFLNWKMVEKINDIINKQTLCAYIHLV